MEKIKVNMSPNPLDVQTIHASQNDGEARQWEFELHNNGELIDTSDVKEQLVFKAYKGGTEQLLPENGSAPTTSPFLGDIRYPQGLLTDQEFTYRQSPTEEDGLAKITDVKGNTIVWNQLAKELNATNWLAESATASYSDGICTLTPSGYNGRISADADIIANHKYLMLGDFTNVDNQPVYFYIGAIGSYSTGIRIPQTSVLTRQSKIYTATETGKIYIRNNSNTGVVTIKNLMLFDLTQMGLDITDPSEFTSLFNLPYYSYNQGSLLSFNCNGIKTVGHNLCTRTNQSSNIYNASNLIRVKQGQTIYWGGVWTSSTSESRFWPAVYSDPNETNKNNYISYGGFGASGVVNSYTAQNDGYLGLAYAGAVSNYSVEKMMISFAPFTFDEYEPYTSSTLSLPISTYFPNGMKSAGTVYDELTESKAITRIGAVDLGSLTWTAVSTNTSGVYRMRSSGLQGLVKNTSSTSEVANIICALYDATSSGANYRCTKGIAIETNGMLFVYDENYNASTSPETFKSAMSGVYLYYEMVAETETSFTTASLVTENGEVALANENGVLVGKCNSDVSAEPGFHDAKIKLADSDGECYSNKIQLHIERSPQ